MDFLDLDVDTSSESEFDYADMDDYLELELMEDRQRPKNKNYINETVENFSETEFIEHFRLSKHVANRIIEQFEESDLFKHQSGIYGKITAKQHVLIFLWFAGHEAASFRDVADRFDISISTLFRIIRRLIYFLSNLAPQIITWPDAREKQEIEIFFRDKNFPGVIGAIDGSHIRIDKPEQDPDSYYNRKKYFSIQMQVVCDHQKKIRSLFVGFPGSVHDARVFRTSSLSQQLPDKCGDYFILGDSAYSCSRHLITPFKDQGNLTRRQRLFNQRLSSCRYVIEHCFGLLKQKFRQLYHCKLRSINDIVNFIRACCVLHNMSIDDEFDLNMERNENEPEPNRNDPHIIDEDLERDIPEGIAFRNYLLQTLRL